jgi:hypothetical protein
MSELAKISDLSSTIWDVFLSTEKKDFGKYSTIEVLRLLGEKRIVATDLIWASPLTEWVTISALKENLLERSKTRAGPKIRIKPHKQIRILRGYRTPIGLGLQICKACMPAG